MKFFTAHENKFVATGLKGKCVNMSLTSEFPAF